MWGAGYESQKSPLQKMIDALPEAKPGLVVESIKVVQLIAELDDCEVSDIAKLLKYSNYKAYKLFSLKCMDCSKSGPIKAAVKKIETDLNAAWLRCCESVRQGKEQVLNGIEFLIQCGADINWQEPGTGKTLLHYAIEEDHAALITLLKTHNAKMDIPAGPFHITALQLEAEKGQPMLYSYEPLQYGGKK